MYLEQDLMRYKTLFGALLTAILLFAGCSGELQNNTMCDNGSSSVMGISSPFGMMKYLSDVPAIKKLSRWDNPYGAGITIQINPAKQVWLKFRR